MRALPASVSLSGALLACLLAAGCTDTGDSPNRPAPADPPAAQTTSSDPEPTSSPTTTTPAPEPTPTPATLADRLLATHAVPGLNAGWRWQDGRTGAAGTEPFGLCAKVDLASIGATDVVERTYFPPDDSDDNAAEQIAELPDANTAARAWAVLKSWHDTCAKKSAQNPGLKVRALTSVPVPAGSARWYLLSWEPAGEETGRFEAFGMVLQGTRVAVLRMDSSSQDYNYPAGKEPMVAMVKAAAARLG